MKYDCAVYILRYLSCDSFTVEFFGICTRESGFCWILESGKWGSGKVPQMAFPKNSELGSIGEMKCVLCTQFFLRTVDVSTSPRVLYCGSSR